MNLAFITQKRLELASAGAAAVGAYFLPRVNGIAVWASVAVYLLAYFLPSAFNFLKGLAKYGLTFDVPEWPKFVACGIGIVFSAAHGHVSGVLTSMGLLAAIDGDFWPY